MPPEHIGRWDLPALQVVAGRHGFHIAEWELEPRWARPREAWLLALYWTNSRACNPATLEGRVQAMSFRPARGLLQRLVAIRWLPTMWRRAKGMLSHNQWVHLVRA
jgi:hypothetical protein